MDDNKKKMLEAFAQAIADGKGWMIPFANEEEAKNPNDLRNLLKQEIERIKGKS